MKVLLTIWITAVLIQEVIPNTLVRRLRHTSNQPSLVHTEYEAKYEQRGKHGNESSGVLTGKQEIVHDHCSDDWNAFADKCAALIKDLVASLANAVSSQPGDATNLQLQIKNTFRHFDNTNNCTCFNHSDIDLSPLFSNITVNTIAPSSNINGGSGGGASNCGGSSQSCDGDSDLKNGIVNPVSSGDGGEGNASHDGNGHNSGLPQKSRQPSVSLHQAEDPGVRPEGDGDSDSTNNNRRQAKYPQISRQPGNSQPYYPKTPNNIKRAPYPFLVTPQPDSAPNPLGTVPYSNDNNLPNGGNVGHGPGPNTSKHFQPGQTPPTLMTAAPVPDSYPKPAVAVPAVAVPALGESNTKPAAIAPAISAPVSPNLGKGGAFPNAAPVTNNGPGSNTVPVVPVGTIPVLTSSKPNKDHLSPQGQILGAPVINSQSNLPESEGPESQGGTTNPLPIAPGPNPSIAVVKDPNSTIPEVLPVSTIPTVPEADNQQSGVPSDAGNPLTEAAILPTIAVPASDTEDCDKTEENGSGNGNAMTSPLPVYPVYVPKTNSSSGGSGPNGGLGGSVPAVVPNTTPTSQDGEDCDSNTGTNNDGATPVVDYPAKVPAAVPQNVGQTDKDCDDCDSNTETNNDGTTPVVPLPALPQYAGPTAQGSPLTTAGSGPGDDQKENYSPTILNAVPVTKPASEDCDDCDSNTGANDGTTPVVAYPTKIPAAVPQHIGQSDQECDGCDSNTGSNSAGTTPIAVYPVETPLAGPQNAGQTGSGTPLGNAGSGPNGGHAGSVPSIPSAVPDTTPTSQGGEDCDSETGTVNGATTPVVVYPVAAPTAVPSNAGPAGEGCDDCDSNTGNNSAGTTSGVGYPATVPVVVPSNAGPTDQGSGSPLDNGGLEPVDGLVTTPTSQGGEDCDSKTGPGNDATTPVAVYPVAAPEAVPSSAGPTSQGSGTPLAVPTAVPVAVIPAAPTAVPTVVPAVVPTAVPVLPVKSTTSQAGDGNAPVTESTSPYPSVVQPLGPALEGSGSPDSNPELGQTDSSPPAVSNTPAIPPPASLGVGEHQPTGNEEEPFDSGIENISPTTFQTTSSDPTSPQSILIPTASTLLDPEPSTATSASPQTQESHSDDEDDEDCCSCESCTEEEITDPKQYKENACKNLEEARRELKAIFDKIKKKLKCGRKGMQTITTTASVNSN